MAISFKRWKNIIQRFSHCYEIIYILGVTNKPLIAKTSHNIKSHTGKVRKMMLSAAHTADCWKVNTWGRAVFAFGQRTTKQSHGKWHWKQNRHTVNTKHTICVHVGLHLHAYRFTCTQTWTHTCMHTFTHIYIHMHTHILVVFNIPNAKLL